MGKKEFVFETRTDSFLNAQVINANTKEGDGSAIKIGMKLMKQRLCFRITAKLENSKRQHYSRQEKKKKKYIYIYIYIYEKGSTLLFTYESQEHFICSGG